RRHPDVGEDEVGPVRAGLADQVLGVGGPPHHLVPALLEQQDEPLAHQRLVLADHDAHGTSATIRVPRPGGLSTRRRPSRASMRSASPPRPPPPTRAPPTPSSAI